DPFPGQQLDQSQEVRNRTVLSRQSPDPQPAVDRGDPAAIRAEPGAVDPGRVLERRGDRLARGRLPGPRPPLPPAREDPPPPAAPSQLPVRPRRPSGLTSACSTAPLWRRSGVVGAPVAASQTRAAPLYVAVRTRRPSGLNRASITIPLCRSGGVVGAPVAAS